VASDILRTRHKTVQVPVRGYPAWYGLEESSRSLVDGFSTWMEGNYGLEFLRRLAFRILFIGIIRFLKSMWILHRRFLAAIKSLPYDVPCEFILFGGHQNPNYIELVSRIAEEVSRNMGTVFPSPNPNPAPKVPPRSGMQEG